MTEPRNQTPYQIAVQSLLTSLSSDWQAAETDMTAGKTTAVNQLIGRGLVEARYVVTMRVGDDVARATWRVCGDYHNALQEEVEKYLEHRHEPETKATFQCALSELRLTAFGERVQGMLRPDTDYGVFGGEDGDTWENIDPIVERDASQPAITLHEQDLKILRYLAKSTTTKSQFDIEAGAQISRRTLTMRLETLRKAGFTHTPNGPRSGEAITEAGREILTRAH